MMPLPDAAPGPAFSRVHQVSQQHALDVHPLEDGAVLLAARRPGQPGALDAVHAAIALDAADGDAVVSVFGQAVGERLEDAIERGSQALEYAAMQQLFAEVIGPAAPIRVDEVIADLVCD